nr:hypothetical protein [Tanacetum cinerariifolium]
ETVGLIVVEKSGIQCYNCKEFGHVTRECQKPKRVKDATYHREKMLLCKQEEARIQLNAEQDDWRDDTDDELEDQELEAHYMYMAQLQEQEEARIQLNAEQDDWRDDTDDELEDQELEAHYMYMAQLQEVSPDVADSGPIFDAEPLQKTDQNDDDNDLASEHELLASLIKKLKCEIDDKSSNNCFKEANNKLSEINNLLYNDFKKSQAELARCNDVEYALKVEIDCAKARGDLISYKMESQKSFNKYTQTINDLNQMISEMKEKLCANQETISIMSQQKEAQIKFYKTREDNELDKVIALENKVKDLKAQLQDKGIVISELKKLIEKLKGKSVNTKFEKSSDIRQPNAFKSQRPSILGKPTTFPNSLERNDFSKSKSVTQNNVSNDFSKPVTEQNLPPNKQSILKNTNVLAPEMLTKECHKLLTDSVDDPILRHNVSNPLPLGGPPGQLTIQSDFFFKKDLEYLRYGSKGSRPALSIWKIKAAYYPDVGLEQMVPDHAIRTHMRILSVVKIEVFSMYVYDYMKKIFLRRADLNEHVIAERDFKYLAIRQRVEDFQLVIERYQTQLNLTKPRWDATGFEYKHDYTVIDSPRAVTFRDRYGVQMMMHFNEIHKFGDGTLQQIDEALDYRVKEFQINRMNPSLNKRTKSFHLDPSCVLAPNQSNPDPSNLFLFFLSNKAFQDCQGGNGKERWNKLRGSEVFLS